MPEVHAARRDRPKPAARAPTEYASCFQSLRSPVPDTNLDEVVAAGRARSGIHVGRVRADAGIFERRPGAGIFERRVGLRHSGFCGSHVVAEPAPDASVAPPVVAACPQPNVITTRSEHLRQRDPEGIARLVMTTPEADSRIHPRPVAVLKRGVAGE
jgi:hypothetical protein